MQLPKAVGVLVSGPGATSSIAMRNAVVLMDPGAVEAKRILRALAVEVEPK